MLVTGCGPIGALVMLAARRAGVLEIVATDLTEATLQFARKIGADRTVNTSSDPDALASYTQGKGYFDAAFEATSALRNCIETVRPGGVIVQLGLGGGDTSVPMQMVTAKELQLRGSFWFHEEFAVAVDYIDKGMIDVKPLAVGDPALHSSARRVRARERSIQVDEGATRILTSFRQNAFSLFCEHAEPVRTEARPSRGSLQT